MGFIEINRGELVYMQAENLNTPHAFTTRMGGVSGGIYESLNLGTSRGDDPNLVRKNYKIICSAMDTAPERLVFSKQVHEDTVRAVTSKDSLGDIMKPVPYEADALITQEKQLPLIIFTADCMPILLHDLKAPCIGACHAGWRGTVMDIAGKTVASMCRLSGGNPENIKAAIGPGIGPCCFETGSEVPQAVTELLGGDGREFISCRGGGKFMVDLPSVNKLLLIRAGVPEENITVSPECTLCNNEKYWSHRHTDGQRGSQASLIML